MKVTQEAVCTCSVESDQLYSRIVVMLILSRQGGRIVALCIATVRTWLVLFWLHWLGGGGLFCRAVSVVVGNNRHFLGLRQFQGTKPLPLNISTKYNLFFGKNRNIQGLIVRVVQCVILIRSENYGVSRANWSSDLMPAIYIPAFPIP